MKKHLTALLLAAIMVLPLFACANDTGNLPNDTTAPTDPQTTTQPSAETTVLEETEPKILPDIPAVGDQYKGTTLTIAHRGTGNAHYNEPWIYAEQINGDTINDAVYRRNSYIEEKYGVSIVEQIESDPMEAIELAVNSQDDLYDIAFPKVNTISNGMLKGMLYNLHDLPHVDFDKPWWDSNCAEDMTYRGNLFLVASDISLNITTGIFAYLFNRDLVRNYGLEDPYALVKENRWTAEKLRELIQQVGDDVDGDNQYTDEDVYGMMIDDTDIRSFVLGMGSPMYNVFPEGDITAAFFNEKTIDILTFCRSFWDDTVHTRNLGDLSPTDGSDRYSYSIELFAADHFLFLINNVRSFDSFAEHNMESEYGIVPNPKWDADQESYMHMLDKNNTGLVVPSTNQESDLERLSILLEDMAYMSSQTVLPEYYETIIKLRRSRVPEVGEMVDLIKNSIRYDISFFFNTGYGDALDTAFSSGNYASTFTRYERIINNTLSKIVKSLDALG